MYLHTVARTVYREDKNTQTGKNMQININIELCYIQKWANEYK